MRRLILAAALMTSGVVFAADSSTFQLARIRKKLKVTQVEAARITGGGPNAFSRYERGKARPLPAVTNLFRLLDRHPELLNELQD